MARKNKKDKFGDYICKVGYLDIRQKIILPIKRRLPNKIWETTAGTCECFIYHTKHKLAGPFKGKEEAVKKAKEMLKKRIKYEKHNKS